MHRVLIVDDDETMRRLIRLNLEDDCEVLDTGVPEDALALALQHRPDAILLDLRMPRYSGFELCQTLTSFSSTQMIPVIVVSGEAGAKTKQICRELGAVDYFEKPVDFETLRTKLKHLFTTRRKERRSETRVKLRVPLRIEGKDNAGGIFNVLTTTENVSRASFLSSCAVALEDGTVVDVFLARGKNEHVGTAKVIRSEWNETVYPRYACRFTEATENWVFS
jgi:DNA-binding response OmpR family regulator